MLHANDTLVKVFLNIRSKVARSVAGIVPKKDLEDVVQDTFLRIQDLKGANDIRNPEAFIYQIARNLALDHVKRAGSRLLDGYDDVEQAQDVIDLLDDDSVYREVVSGQEFGDFCSAVHELPDQCRRVFVLRKVYGFSQKEIANSLGISQSSVEKHVARGLKLIHRYLNNRDHAHDSIAPVTDIAHQRAKRYKQ
ncbi:MAG: RNA polymerase sigma factor [Pseudomonadales bacterium]